MLYSKLVQMAERYLGDIAVIVKAAVVFNFDITPHQSLAKFSDEPTLAWLRHEFRLPYPIIGIEDRASCIVLAERPLGLAAERVFIECLPGDLAGTDSAAYHDSPDKTRSIEDALRRAPAGCVIVTVGTFSASSLSHEGFGLAGHLQRAICGTPERLAWRINDPDPQDANIGQMCAGALSNAMTAIEEIVHIQRLPGFTAWPEIHEHSPRMFDVEADGRIIHTRRDRVAESWG